MIEQDFESFIRISARTGEGVDKLLEAIEANLPVRMKRVSLLVPFANAGIISEIREKGTLLSEEYVADGVKAEAVVDEQLYHRVKNYET